MARWPLRTAYFWEEAPFFRLLLPLCCGILLYDTGYASPLSCLLAVCLSCCAGLVAIHLLSPFAPPLKVAFFPLLIVLLLGIGQLVCFINDDRNDAAWIGRYTGNARAWMLRIEEQPQQKERTWKLPVRLLAAVSENEAKTCNGRALLYVYRNDSTLPYRRGDTLLLRAQWQPLRPTGNPFSFDLVSWYRHNNIFFQAFVPPDSLTLLGKGSAADDDWITRRRDVASSVLDRYFPREPYRGLMKALLLGETQDFDRSLRQAYADTGVIHIVAISGSHIATLFLLVSGLLFWIRSRKYAWIRYAAGLSVAWLYVLLAGAPPSALRSVVMFSFIAAGVLLNREHHPLNTLLAAAFILLLGNPMWLFSVGFQLSFIAVLALILVYPPLYRCWTPRNLLLRKMWQCMAASIAVELLAAPLVIFCFHNFPLLFLPANIIAWLFMGFIAMVGGFLVLVCAFFPPLAECIAFLVTVCIGWFNTAMLALQRCNPPALQHLYLSLPELCLLYVALASLLYAGIAQQKKALLPGLLALVVLLALFCRDEWAALQQRRLVVYHDRNGGVELMEGKHCRILVSGGTMPDQARKDARCGWRAWRTKETAGEALVRIGGRTVLILAEKPVLPHPPPFRADVLVVVCPLRSLSLAELVESFQPGQLVVGGRQPEWVLDAWQDSCARRDILFHATSRQGAWIAE